MAVQTTHKYSKQREAILACLKGRTDHPTADSIYQAVQHTIPNISLGTVYRNLAVLSKNGDILKLSCDGKTDRFDAATHPHYHFLCKQCGCVQDIEIPYAKQFDQLAKNTFEGTVTGHSLLFEGYCKDCAPPA